jgi:hypothetical protein
MLTSSFTLATRLMMSSSLSNATHEMSDATHEMSNATHEVVCKLVRFL